MKNSITKSLILMLIVLMSVSSVFAVSGSIWTTNGDCGDESQDINHYAVGDTVYVNGANFDDEDDPHAWSITGQPGQASCDPSAVVASGNENVGIDGVFCFPAYVVQPDDCGEYKVDFGNKNDNYRVDEGQTSEIPEFTSLTAALVLAGAGYYIHRKRSRKI